MTYFGFFAPNIPAAAYFNPEVSDADAVQMLLRPFDILSGSMEENTLIVAMNDIEDSYISENGNEELTIQTTEGIAWTLIGKNRKFKTYTGKLPSIASVHLRNHQDIYIPWDLTLPSMAWLPFIESLSTMQELNIVLNERQMAIKPFFDQMIPAVERIQGLVSAKDRQLKETLRLALASYKRGKESEMFKEYLERFNGYRGDETQTFPFTQHDVVLAAQNSISIIHRLLTENTTEARDELAWLCMFEERWMNPKELIDPKKFFYEFLAAGSRRIK